MARGLSASPSRICSYSLVVSAAGSTPSSSARRRRQVSYWARAALRWPLSASVRISAWWAASSQGSSSTCRQAIGLGLFVLAALLVGRRQAMERGRHLAGESLPREQRPLLKGGAVADGEPLQKAAPVQSDGLFQSR